MTTTDRVNQPAIRRAVAAMLTAAAVDVTGKLHHRAFFACPTGGDGVAYVARLTSSHVAVFTEDVWEDLIYRRAVEVAVYDVDRWEGDEHPEPVDRYTADDLADAMSWLAEFNPADHA